MNMQKMGKLCKENRSMKLYRKGCTQYIWGERKARSV